MRLPQIREEKPLPAHLMWAPNASLSPGNKLPPASNASEEEEAPSQAGVGSIPRPPTPSPVPASTTDSGLGSSGHSSHPTSHPEELTVLILKYHGRHSNQTYHQQGPGELLPTCTEIKQTP